MEYRMLGKTGIRVSEIGLGCEGFVGKDDNATVRMMNTAIEGGINFLDLYSPDPDLRSRIGRSLRGRRDGFILQAHMCTAWKNGQYEATRNIGEVKSSFNDLLERLETDYIDVGMIHYVDSLTLWKETVSGGIMDWATELKNTGVLRSVGLSTHNPAVGLEAAESGLIDVIMFSINPCYDLLPGSEDCEELWSDKSYSKPLLNMDPERERLYETCQRLGVAITVMKCFGGGDLLTSNSPAGMALTAEQCIHYALTRPAAASVMCGAHSEDEIVRCLSYETASAEEKDYAAALAEFPKISWHGRCMYCGHCAPCPVNIDVASVTKFLNLALAQGNVPETVQGHYDALPHHAGECLECGACESRCPFGVSVRSNMKKTCEIFGK